MVAHHSLNACPPNYHRFAPSVIVSLVMSTMIFSCLPAVLYFVYLGLAVVDAATMTLDWNIEYTTANPDGQFEILKAASPVYEFLGVDGLAVKTRPELNRLVTSRLGYFIRPGKHQMTREDWKVFLDYADQQLK